MLRVWIAPILTVSLRLPPRCLEGADIRLTRAIDYPHSLSTRSQSRCHRQSIKRREGAKRDVMRQTGYAQGRKGGVGDHIGSLACGGAHDLSNVPWQKKPETQAEDNWERKGSK